MSRFTLFILIASGLILLTVFGLKIVDVTTPSYCLETTVLLAISTWVSAKKLVAIQSSSTFVQAYLLSIVIKLVAWLGYLAVVFYLDRVAAPGNAVYFMINSLMMIGLEVYFLFSTRAHSG